MHVLPTCKLPEVLMCTKRKAILDKKHCFNSDDFIICHELGEGKFARVYKATSPMFGEVALRILKVSEVAAVNTKKLQIEAMKLCKLNHSNVIKCFGLILSKAAFVLEYCCLEWNIDGEVVNIHSLFGLIQIIENDIPLKLRLTAIKDVSAGLCYLHDNDVVAGDLKPSNVLISTVHGQIIFKLSDLNTNTSSNIACSLLSTSYNMMTSSDAVFTTLYIAPELINSDYNIQLKQNAATDIYALSILMYQVLFPSETVSTSLTQLQHLESVKNKWRPLVPNIDTSEDTVEVPVLVIEWMKKCWDEIPSARPTAQDIYESVNAILCGDQNNETLNVEGVESINLGTRNHLIEEHNMTIVKNDPETIKIVSSESGADFKKQKVFERVKSMECVCIANTIKSEADNAFADSNVIQSMKCESTNSLRHNSIFNQVSKNPFTLI